MSFVIEETPEGLDLVVTGEWNEDVVRRFQVGDVDGLVLNYARGFLGERIPKVKASLDRVQHLRRLFFFSYNEPDLLPLTLLPELESLAMKGYPGLLSLEGRQLLPRLTRLAIHRASRLVGALAGERCITYLSVAECGDIASAAPLASLTSLTGATTRRRCTRSKPGSQREQAHRVADRAPSGYGDRGCGGRGHPETAA